MNISIVAAIGENFELGANGDLLWRLPLDMQRFKQITLHHHVVMGRKTFESLPPKFRPLPNRVNIVVTSNSDFEAKDCLLASSLNNAISIAQNAGEKDLMIIGGAQIYNQALALAHTLYITRVHAVFPEADVFFPKWNEKKWKITSEEKFAADEKHAFAFDFLRLERIHYLNYPNLYQ
jgi:dihydrofolate reductase